MWIRLLILVALVLIFLYGLRALVLRTTERLRELLGEPPRAHGRGQGAPRGQQTTRQIGELVACPTCGVHVLSSRMIGDGHARYCSEACREKAAARAR